jgi:cellulose synthase/poly-beta-1,6-N-acetylglucosamine synthase-like glycosyltransferase
MDIGAGGLYVCLFIALYFEVFLLISFFEKKPALKTAAKPHYYPTVSVIIPCWNKALSLGGTVESLLALEYPKNKLSIVIIDDGSTDNTWEVAQQFATNPQIKIFQKENQGSKYSALNFGIEHSDGEFVGCLDADSFVAPDALSEIVKAFNADPELMAVAPAMKVNRPRKVLELMQSVEYTFGIFYKKMFDNLAAISVLPGPFSIYRRTLFGKIGMFRKAHHTEDMEMAFRMHANGLKIGNVHTAIVYTNVPTTVRTLVRQRTRWSRGYLENSRDYAYMYFNRRYGNFGMLVLPFGLVAFCAGLYTAGYALYRLVSSVVGRISDLYATGVPPQVPALHNLSWYYIDTNTMTFVIVAVFCFTMVAVLLGQHIAMTKLRLRSYVAYFVCFGFIAPLWLARAAWDTLARSERGWLT